MPTTKVIGFLLGVVDIFLYISYISHIKAEYTVMTLISAWLVLETPYLHHSLILGRTTFSDIFVKIRHDDVT